MYNRFGSFAKIFIKLHETCMSPLEIKLYDWNLLSVCFFFETHVYSCILTTMERNVWLRRGIIKFPFLGFFLKMSPVPFPGFTFLFPLHLSFLWGSFSYFHRRRT